MNKLKQLEEALVKAQYDMGQVLEQAGQTLDMSKVTAVAGSTEEKCAAFRKMNQACTDAQIALEAHRGDLKAKEDWEKRQTIVKVTQPGSGPEKKGRFVEPELKNFGDAMLELSDEQGFKKFFKEERELPAGVNLKTLMDTTSWVPETLRTGKVVDKAVRPIQVLDLIPAGQTSQAAVVYMEETTLTENAAETTEGSGVYPENAYAMTERSSTVRKIAAFLPVTDEQLEDVAQVRGYINRRLPESLRRRMDSQVINGNGTPPNLQGLLTVSGVQTYSRTTVPGDKPVDALKRAQTLSRITGRSMPNAVVINPNDWEDIRLMKTNDGAYVWGHPAEPGIERVWGMALAQGDVIAEGTALVGDFSYCELAERRGIVVKVSDSHDTYFIYGKQAIRADLRVAFVIYRPAAFVKVTL